MGDNSTGTVVGNALAEVMANSVLSIISVLLNIQVTLVVCTSKRLRDSPKYWPVLTVSMLYILQASLSNSAISSMFFSGGSADWQCCSNVYLAAWATHFLFTALTMFYCLFINLDYLICIASSKYTRLYRNRLMILAMAASAILLTPGCLTMTFMFGKVAENSSNPSLIFFENTKVLKALIWIILFVPAAMTIVVCVVNILYHSSERVKALFGMNQDLESSIEAGIFPLLQPLDHTAFLLILVVVYFPYGLLLYNGISCSTNSCFSLWIFRDAARLMFINGGTFAPWAWFFFGDFQKSLRKLLRRILRLPLDDKHRSTSELSDMKLFDTYPYCSLSL